MSKKIPSKLSFFSAFYICVIAVLRPSLLEEIEDQDNKNLETAHIDDEKRLLTVCKAFWNSFALILLFAAFGIGVGGFLKCVVGIAPPVAITALQILGAILLLWGTLFVRGFEIQSHTCVTLSERVNQWLYRGLYCIGTAVIVCSLVWGSS